MKVASLFAGIGGFDLALTRQGHEIIYANEWDKYAAEIYEKNFNQDSQSLSKIKQDRKGRNRSSNKDRSDKLLPRHSKPTSHRIDTRDIREVKDIPDHDILCGGFPCQAFSIAGKRGGFDDTRGTLFFEVARIAKQKQPRLLLLENVKGLLSHDKGATFGTILNTLDEIGYDCQWQVLNSKNFGVPQNRERVFIVGHLRGTPRPQVFPLGNTNESDIQSGKELPVQISNTLRTNYSSGYSNETYVSTDKPNTQQEGNKSNSTNRIRRTPYTDGMRIRRLTPLECERLQGFPDGWTEGISDTQRYKCLGNAVTVNVVEAIIKQL